MKKRQSITTFVMVLTLIMLAAAQAVAQGRIVFTSDRDGNYEIYSMAVDGSDQLRLTSDVREDYSPKRSPDGSKIAFFRRVDDPVSSHALMLMNDDGSGQVEITRLSLPAFRQFPPFTAWEWQDVMSLGWSPDGNRIVYQAATGLNYYGLPATNIFVVDRDGTGKVQVTNVDDFWIAHHPSWSPDGSSLFYALACGNSFIYIMKPDGSGARILPTQRSDWGTPSLSPSGDKVAYIRGMDWGFSSIFIQNLDGTGERLVVEGNWFAERPQWSPDSTKLVYHDRTQPYPTQDVEIFVASADGTGGTKQLTNTPGRNGEPHWVSAPPVTISGRVRAPDGTPIRGARVTMAEPSGSTRSVITSSLGFFQFDLLTSGTEYTVHVSSKRFRFESTKIRPTDSLALPDIVGME